MSGNVRRTSSRLFGLPGVDPQLVDGVADGVEGEGQPVHGGDHHGEVLFAVPEIVFEVVKVVSQDIEGLVLDFPQLVRGAPGRSSIFRGLVASDGGEAGRSSQRASFRKPIVLYWEEPTVIRDSICRAVFPGRLPASLIAIQSH